MNTPQPPTSWLAQSMIRHARLWLAGALLLAIAGVAAWLSMPRQEDPEIAVRGGMVIIPFAGADALTVERLVVKPVEEALDEIAEIDHVKATARDDVAIFNIILRDQVSDVDPVWEDIDAELDQAALKLPAGAGPIQTNWDLFDLESVLIGVTGDQDPLVLAAQAEALRDALKVMPGVSRVEISADPGEQITVTLDEPRALALGVTAPMLAQALRGKTQRVPAGSVRVDGLKVAIDARSELETLEAIRAASIPLPDGGAVQLSAIAQVRREPSQPREVLARIDGAPAVVVGVVPQDGIDVVAWGARVREVIARQQALAAPLTLQIITSQPERVEGRLNDLGGSLAQGVAIVALVLCLTMGLRVGLTIALIVPLVALAALAVFSASGGLLQQFSIAGLVVSLGLLVDNAIVVGERIQELVDAGRGRVEAAQQAVTELTWPLVAATGTTVAAFMPLLLARGPVGEFTRGIPWLVTVTMLISLVFALTVTPLLAIAALRPRRAARPRGESPRAWGALLARVPVRHPLVVLALAAGLMAAVAPLAGRIKREFFPLADREQLLVELELADGAHLTQTDAQLQRLERELLGRAGVAQVVSFVGASTPRFYYNLPLKPSSPQLAQVLVTLDDASARFEQVEWLRERGRALYPGARFVARVLEQGPPTAAPIEVRLYGDSFAALAQATEQVSAIVAAAPATRDVRHDLPQGRPTLVLDPHEGALSLRGVERAQLAQAVLARTRGLSAGALRGGDDVVPLVVRSGAGEDSGASLELVALGAGRTVASAAATRAQVKPAAIYRRDDARVVSVLAQLEAGRGFNEALAHIRPALQAMEWPAGVRYEIGGAEEASGAANKAIGAAAPWGVALLLGCLIWQFRSLRRLGIILATIPLSAVGVLPGLYLWEQPFGFQSLLGVLSLAGIVVNNAIILIDVFDVYREAGMTVDEALERAVQDRIRPILLTTATTVLGLTPLLWSSSALWPPMASAMITGLLASTALTLWVVPALCKLAFSMRVEAIHAGLTRSLTGAAVAALCLVAALPLAQAQQAGETMTLEVVLARAGEAGPLGRALRAPVEASQAQERAAFGAAWLPVVQVRGELVRRSDELAIETPIGAFVQQRVWGGQGVVALSQPVVQLERQVAGQRAASAALEQAEAQARRRRAELRYQAAQLYLGQLKLEAQDEALEGAQQSLRGQLGRVEALLATSRGVETDRLRLLAAIEELEQSRVALAAAAQGLAHELGRLVGAPGPVYAAALGEEALSGELEEGEGARQERAALEAQLRAVEAQRDGLRWQWAPTLHAEARLIHQINTPLATATWGEVGATLVWTPFVAGTREAQADALEAQALGLRAALDDLDAARSAELGRLRAGWEASRSEAAAMERVIAQRAQIAAQVQAQYAQGRAVLTDVLEVEAALAASRARRQAARLDALERRLGYALALER